MREEIWMDNKKWIEHLSHWKTFLETRLSTADDEREYEKITRQLTAIENVRYSAVLNPLLLINFINPISKSISNSEESTDYFPELNESQRQAVYSAINNENYLSLIQGPPGTGKTRVITEICLQLYKRNPNIRILICSETHIAVNALLSLITKRDQSIRCIRIRDREENSDLDGLSPSAVMNAYRDWLENTCNDKDIVDAIISMIPEYESKGLEKALALSANVVGMTCNRVGAYRFFDSTEMFDYAIIDEVCKATLPEILMPLIVSEKAILVGDPKQLPPIFCSEDQEIIKNIENCDLQKYMYIDELFVRGGNTRILDTQYRMENKIGRLISNLFYEGTLKNGRGIDIPESLIWVDYIPSHTWPEPEEYAKDKSMIRNLDECAIISKLLYGVAQALENKKNVAVIVPYKQQENELKTRLANYSTFKVAIGTVDGFQGKEADIVIFGITRTSGNPRFIADIRRLNVALSRARDKLIIVGNLEYAKKYKLLAEIADRCKITNLNLL